MGRNARLKADRRRKRADAAAKATPDATHASKTSESEAGPARETAPQSRTARLGEWAVVVVPALIFLFFKAFTVAPEAGDENIYFYAGRRVAEGLWPYREVFFAHPPGHLLIAALWMLPGWFSPFWTTLASVLPALLTLLLAVRLIRKSGCNRWVTLLLASTLALSYNFLSVSSHFTGANWTLFALVLGIWLRLNDRRFAAGLVLGFSTLIAFHLLPAVMGILLADVIFYRKQALRTLAGAVVMVGGGHLFCLIAFGDPYARQVFGYHLSKTAMSHGGAAAVRRFFFNEYHLATLALFSAVIWLKDAIGSRALGGFFKARHPLTLFALSGAAAQTAGVFYVSRVFTYYLAPLLPLFALAGGLFAQRAWDFLVLTLRQRRDRRALKRRLVTAFAVALAFAVCLIVGERLERGMGYYEREQGALSRYDFPESPYLPDAVNAATRALLFTPERRIGRIYPGILLYFWHESVTENPEPLLGDLLALSDRPGTIFGDASAAPYFALASGRTIALEQADTNAQLFKSGLIDMTDLLKRLEADPPAVVVVSPRRGISGHPAYLGWLKAHYRMAAQARLVKNKTLQLFVRTR